MSYRLRRGRRATALLASALTVSVLSATAGCGMFSTTQQAAAPQLERPTLRVGVMKVVDIAPLRMSLNDVFKNAGLDLQLVEEPSEDEALNQLENGAVELVWASHVSMFRAADKGQKLQVEGEAYQAAANTMALVAMPGSRYDDAGAKDKPKIAVNSDRDLGALTTKSVLGVAKVNPNNITFVPTASSDMINSLKAGTVDAAWMVEPYITQAQKQVGARIVTDAARGATQNFPMSGYAASKKFADANPKTLAAFRSALQEAQQRAGNSPLLVQDALPTYAGVDSSDAALVSIGTFPLSLNPIRLQRVADLMNNLGFLNNRLDVQQLLPPGVGN
ncbi:ABC transporter substrate-binding protein [Solihabitans fulvus]|uniref:ABC transporter substrate-binding protein n=1 Tax=Solihabitans fulvus TaxID=1892852 RepID=A0A5B2WF79_9PSEU|nr:ABC transporter substrate-binding protein [Solihabitans fulvus]KAA2248877.1 ABC transporter substrate-binding protein [Solihabitans fulvus]